MSFDRPYDNEENNRKLKKIYILLTMDNVYGMRLK